MRSTQSPAYPAKRGWFASQGLRELIQNLRDGALEAARRLRSSVTFDELRFVRSSKEDGHVVVRIYLNSGRGAEWIKPVYLLAEFKCECVILSASWSLPLLPCSCGMRGKGEIEMINHGITLDSSVLFLGNSYKGRGSRGMKRSSDDGMVGEFGEGMKVRRPRIRNLLL